MVRRNTGPSSDALIEFLTDPRAMAERFGSSPQALFSQYARRVIDSDPGIAAQLRDQLGGSVPRPGAGSASCLQALWRQDAPGAALDGASGYPRSWGELAAAAWHRGSGRGRLAKAIENAMSERVPSAGGFTVGESLRSEMLFASLESSIIRPGATVFPAPSLRTGIPVADDLTHAAGAVLGGVSWAWTPEGKSITASAPSFGKIVFEAHKAAGYIGPVDNELVADGAGALEVFFRQVAPRGYAWFEDSAFINGRGTAEPQGYLNAPAAVPVTRSVSSHISQADIGAMLARCLPQSLKSAVWIASQTAFTDLLALNQVIGTAPAGQNISPSMWVSFSGGTWRLLGQPLWITEHAAALGTAGDLSLLDRSFYGIAERMELAISSADAGQTFQADQTEYKLISRLDGRLLPQVAITPEHGSGTLSPAVVLT